ncbi:MAG: hypothetical protein PHF20_03920 [Halothiobacillaceae bacterium]|nr:hypothetical protein [Halothiobacillaceae bacterium]
MMSSNRARATDLAVTHPRLEGHHVRFTDCCILYQFALPGNMNYSDQQHIHIKTSVVGA